MSITETQVVVLPDGRMDRKAAAAYLGLSPKTLAIFASRGTGPVFIKRGRIWYRKQDLDDWLNGGRATSTAAARLVNPRHAAHDPVEAAHDPVEAAHKPRA